MREIMKRTVAAVMAVLSACAAAGCSSTGNSSSGSSSAGETTTTTAPVVEDMGNIDLSDVTTEYDVPEDFSYESEAEKGTLSGGAAVLDKNFLGKFSGDGFVSVGSSGDMVEFEIDFPAKGSYNITLTDKIGNKCILRLIVNIFWSAYLLDIALIHYNYSIRHCKSFLLVMRYINKSNAKLIFKPDKLVLHILTHLKVECPKRLIKKKHPRFIYDGSRYRNPLLLAS